MTVKLKSVDGREVEVRLGDISKEVALQALLERTTYVLQKKNKQTGQWVTVISELTGRNRANQILNRKKKDNPYNYEYRVLQKNEAQKYTEGWDACRLLVSGGYYPDPEEEIEPRTAT